jgi:hypothetical protein
MRRRAIMGALLLIGVGVALGATVFRTDIAQATGLAQTVTVTNTPEQAVPVREQNLDGNQNIKVHEQGTANVNVTNSQLMMAPVAPITAGGQASQLTGGQDANYGDISTASALTIGFTGGTDELILYYDDRIVARFPGPPYGSETINLALARPVSFDEAHCFGSSSGLCTFGWIGNSP